MSFLGWHLAQYIEIEQQQQQKGGKGKNSVRWDSCLRLCLSTSTRGRSSYIDQFFAVNKESTSLHNISKEQQRDKHIRNKNLGIKNDENRKLKR